MISDLRPVAVVDVRARHRDVEVERLTVDALVVLELAVTVPSDIQQDRRPEIELVAAEAVDVHTPGSERVGEDAAGRFDCSALGVDVPPLRPPWQPVDRRDAAFRTSAGGDHPELAVPPATRDRL